MDDRPNSNRKGRLLIVILGVIAAIFVVASITTNLNVWRQNDAAVANGTAIEAPAE